jgi:hypothetical protein
VVDNATEVGSGRVRLLALLLTLTRPLWRLDVSVSSYVVGIDINIRMFEQSRIEIVREPLAHEKASIL